MLEGLVAAAVMAAAAVFAAIWQGKSTRRLGSSEHAEGRELMGEIASTIARVELQTGEIADDLDRLRDDLDRHITDDIDDLERYD